MDSKDLIEALLELVEQKDRLKNGIQRIENKDFSYIQGATLHGDNYVLSLDLAGISPYKLYQNIEDVILSMLKEKLKTVESEIEEIKSLI